jgi:hypothetical protein
VDDVGELRGHGEAAGGDGADRGDEHLGLGVLGDVATRTGPDRADDVARLTRGGDDEDPGQRGRRRDRRQARNVPVVVEIHNDHVGRNAVRGCCREGLDDPNVVGAGEHLLDAPAGDGVVVHNRDANHVGGS